MSLHWSFNTIKETKLLTAFSTNPANRGLLLTSRHNIHILLLQFPLLLQCCQLTSLLFPLQELLSLQLLLLNLLAVLARLLILLFLMLPTEMQQYSQPLCHHTSSYAAEHWELNLWKRVHCFWMMPHPSLVSIFIYCCHTKLTVQILLHCTDSWIIFFASETKFSIYIKYI